MEKSSLVSVLVITYNSSKYIIETLDSVYSQTYDNIELIISDDGSNDETILVCSTWLANNSRRFIKVTFVTAPINTGIPSNCNRGVAACNGEWIKIIAGDDILLTNCIEDNIRYITLNPQVDVLVSRMEAFMSSGKRIHNKGNLNVSFFKKSCREQYLDLLKDCNIPAPTEFFSSRLLKKNKFNDKYKNLEDYPMWLNILQKGFKIYFMNNLTVRYRIGESVTRSNTHFFSPAYRDSFLTFYWSELNELIKQENNQEAYDYNRKKLLMFEIQSVIFHNRYSVLGNLIMRLIRWFVYRFLHFSIDNN